MIKLIATDIDGTLLADGTLKINPEYYDVIKELRNRGVRVIVASGRQRSSIEKVFAPIVDEISFISENGTAVYSKDYQFINKIPEDVARAYIREARMFPGCEITINKDNMAYFENVGLYRYMIDDYGYRGELVDNIEDYLDDVCKHLPPQLRRKDGKSGICGQMEQNNEYCCLRKILAGLHKSRWKQGISAAAFSGSI